MNFVGGFYHKRCPDAGQKSQISFALIVARLPLDESMKFEIRRNGPILVTVSARLALTFKFSIKIKQNDPAKWSGQESVEMLYIFETALDEVEAVSRDMRENLSNLDRVMKSTAENLQILRDKLEQPAATG
tara:strand:+ start:88729 stop:89121 length:393 start_codon:yes stop_codon:yes gene_type:complete